MSLGELFLIAVGLSMDAFAVSICKGLATGKAKLSQMGVTGLYFGGFQAGMPLIGYFLGKNFESLIVQWDHWIAFILLGVIGANMLRESFGGDDDDEADADYSPKAMLPMAVATSIDALAVGVTFAFLRVNIVPAVSFIGVITFVLSAVGVKIGSIVGGKCKTFAERLGGVILILMGLKILLEHLGVIAF